MSVVLTGTETIVTGVSVTSIDFAGDGTNAPIVTLQVNFGTGPSGAVDIVYPSIDTSSVWLTTITSTGPGTWDLSGTPPVGSVGNHTVVVRATANGLFDEETFTLTVSPP